MADEFFFGLDISSFSPDKKKRLQDFIALFERLTKYDGKKITPVFGDGLSAFNKSLKETRDLLDDINIKMSILNSKKVAPQITPAIKEVRNYEGAVDNAGRQTENFGRRTAKAKSEAELFGAQLTKALSSLRVIAYILPGIGIAGLFNLAFTGLERLVEEFGLLKGAETRQLEYTNKMTEAGLKLLETYKKIGEQSKELFQFEPDTKQDLERRTALMKSQGQSPDKIFEKEIFDGRVRVARADLELRRKLGTVDIKKLISTNDDLNRIIEDKAQDINALQSVIAGGNKKSSSKAKIEQLESDIKMLEFEYKINEKIIFEYYNSRKELEQKQAEFNKFNADQERKRIVETTKQNLSVLIDYNKKILSDARSTADERIAASQKIFDAEKSLAKISEYDKLANISTPPKERAIAENKAATDIRKAINDEDERNDKIRIEFYQRFIKAKAEITKDDLDKDAIANEKIFRDDNQNLAMRLEAYKNYIIAKQEMQNVELIRDRQQGQNSLFGISALTKEEVQAMAKSTATLQANLQADAERQIYDIITSSLDKQLKAVLYFNNQERDETKKAYTLELLDLNNRFDTKKIRYQKWAKERAAIDEKYRKLGLDEDIIQDKESIFRLEQQLRKENSMKIANDGELKKATLGQYFADGGIGDKLTAKRKFDTAVGTQKAINDAILKLEQELQKSKNELTEDELRRAKEKIQKLRDGEKQWYTSSQKIIEALYRFATSVVDQEYENRIARLKEQQEATDQYYENNIEAVEKSNLDEKNKTALSIQLNEQRLESDKAAAVKEKELKHKQAVFDKGLAIAKITLSTAIAVAQALELPPPLGEALAIERALLGAIELATAALTPIPYEHGTPAEGHPGGLARVGEKGKPELVIEPHKSPYWVTKDSIGYLPEGTDVIPMKDIPEFGGSQMKESGWEQTRWLAKQMRKNIPQVKTVNNITIDLGFENYKKEHFL